MLALLLVALANGVGGYYLWRPELAGKPTLYLWLCLTQLPFAALAIYFLWRRGDLGRFLKPKPGDVLRGVSVAGALTIAIWAGRTLLMPHGSPGEAWLARLYIHLGNPLELERIGWVTFVVVMGAILDELIWRAWLQPLLVKRLGAGLGVGATALGYTLGALPSCFLLADPAAGLNPLVLIVALATGLTWGYVAHITGRVIPTMVAHTTLAYFTLLQFRPGL